MSNETLVGSLAKQCIGKYRNTSSLQISRILHKEHPLIFSTVEDARQIVRYYRGAQGKKNRNKLSTDEFIRTREEAMALKYNPFGLPDAVNDSWTPIELPFSKGRGLVIADLHIPYHDVEAVTVES